LTSGAKIGVGIGVGIGFLIISLSVWAILRRKRGASEKLAHTLTATNMNFVDTQVRNVLPNFDPAHGTRTACAVGLVVSWIASVACIATAVSIYLLRNLLVQPLGFLGLYGEFVPLVLNLGAAFCTDCLGYIHATSLRWALQREGRLHFNSNNRLMTSARRSAPNRWFTNASWAFCLIITYAAISQLFIIIGYQHPVDIGVLGLTVPYATGLNTIALAALGVGILGQAIISTWCLLTTSESIPTWSSNPLTITLASRHLGLEHRSGRCMFSVHFSSQDARPSCPSRRQMSAYKADPSIKAILYFVWLTLPLAVAWGTTMFLVERQVDTEESRIVDASFTISPFFTPEDIYNTDADLRIEGMPSIPTQLLLTFAVVAAIQSIMTMAIHCAELLVNMNRDEKTWRAAFVGTSQEARRSHGVKLRTNALASAATSWETLVLFAFKAIAHWLFSLSMIVSFVSLDGGYDNFGYENDHTSILYLWIIFRFVPIFCLSGTALVLAIFASYLAFRWPAGGQPAAWGHLQTLADLVDDWRVTGEGGRLWWGDKGTLPGGEVRHAGASGRKDLVEPIRMDALYSGSDLSLF
jgi:hypothetical protein